MLTMDECVEAVGSTRMVTHHAAPGTRGEHGIVTSVSGTYVFVRFAGETMSRACVPDTLSWKVPEFRIVDHDYDTCRWGEQSYTVLVDGEPWTVTRSWTDEDTDEEWVPVGHNAMIDEPIAEEPAGDAWDELRHKFGELVCDELEARNVSELIKEAVSAAVARLAP